VGMSNLSLEAKVASIKKEATPGAVKRGGKGGLPPRRRAKPLHGGLKKRNLSYLSAS